jgi:dTDP-4-dehydrorhamnose 3,5-epimerase
VRQGNQGTNLSEQRVQYWPLDIDGAFLIDLKKREDERGFFARMFCSEDFTRHGLIGTVAQINSALSVAAGTLRGLHYQIAPMGEVKLVRCIRGAAYDVLVDMREKSASFGRSIGIELNADNRRMMYIPPGCAHGYLTLADDTEMLYLASVPYSAMHERALRWDDPKFAIRWPRQPVVMSEKDRTAPHYSLALHSPGY